MTGWIKLHREILTSTTFETLTLKQKMIAIYLILNANHEDGIWTDNIKGLQVEIKRGQVITSPQKIADEWFKKDKEVTRQVVRTTLAKLSKLDFLTMSSTNNYTVINLTNYCVYQAKENEDNQEPNQVLTKSQPSLNQVLTTNKNVKNVKNEKKEDKKKRPKVAPSDLDLENAHLLFEKVLVNFPLAKKPNFENWGHAFRKIREQDKLTDDRLTKHLIVWSQEDRFWHKNIHSADTFRAKYHQLFVAAKSEVDKRIVPIDRKAQEIENLKERYRNEQT